MCWLVVLPPMALFTAAEAIGRLLYPARTEAKARAAWVAELTTEAIGRRFGRL
jgi:hypothetical protein